MKKFLGLITAVAMLASLLSFTAMADTVIDMPTVEVDFDDWTGALGTHIADNTAYPCENATVALRTASYVNDGYGYLKIIEDGTNKYLETYGTGTTRQNVYTSIVLPNNKKYDGIIKTSVSVLKASKHDNVSNGGFLRMHVGDSSDGAYKQITNLVSFDTAGNLILANGNANQVSMTYDTTKWYNITATMNHNNGTLKLEAVQADNPANAISTTINHTYINTGVLYFGYGVGVHKIDNIKIEEIEPTLDLVSANPSNGAVEVDYTPDNLTYTFGDTVDASTLNTITVKDSKGNDATIKSVSLSDDGKTATVVLDGILNYDTYTADLRNVATPDGLKCGKTVSFTTKKAYEYFTDDFSDAAVSASNWTIINDDRGVTTFENGYAKISTADVAGKSGKFEATITHLATYEGDVVIGCKVRRDSLTGYIDTLGLSSGTKGMAYGMRLAGYTVEEPDGIADIRYKQIDENGATNYLVNGGTYNTADFSYTEIIVNPKNAIYWVCVDGEKKGPYALGASDIFGGNDYLSQIKWNVVGANNTIYIDDVKIAEHMRVYADNLYDSNGNVTNTVDTAKTTYRAKFVNNASVPETVNVVMAVYSETNGAKKLEKINFVPVTSVNSESVDVELSLENIPEGSTFKVFYVGAFDNLNSIKDSMIKDIEIG